MKELIQIKFFEYFIRSKKAFVKYFVLSLAVGVVELLGVALTYPFINSVFMQENSFSIKTTVLCFAIVLAFLAKNIFMIFYSALQADFAKDCESYINKQFVKFFVYGSYQYVTQTSLAQKNQITGFLIPNAINNYLLRLLNLNVNLFIFILIISFLFVKFFTASIITLVSSFILLFAQTAFFRIKSEKIAKKLEKANEELAQRRLDATINSKNIKILRKEDYFYNTFCKKLDIANELNKQASFYRAIPPYIIEPLIIILLMILLVIITIQNMAVQSNLIASYALVVTAIFRLAPTISRIQVNLTGINTVLPLVKKLISYYETFNISNLPEKPYQEPVREFNQSIVLKDVCFSYADKVVLNNINLKINKGEFIGIAGLTGSGKTTLIDIISGVIPVKSGQLFLDENFVNSPQMPPLKIGYIPQDYTIIKGSIRENVALGEENIDDERVVAVLKQAQLFDFIQENFEEGIYATPFVDNIGFSQGQKQRLVIARALYINPDIIILDEATSSLDLKTEDEICNVLNSLKGEKTIIAIAHRLSTIKNADRILFMKNATIDAIGSFEELQNNNDDFKELVLSNRTNFIH